MPKAFAKRVIFNCKNKSKYVLLQYLTLQEHSKIQKEPATDLLRVYQSSEEINLVLSDGHRMGVLFETLFGQLLDRSAGLVVHGLYDVHVDLRNLSCSAWT